MEMLQRNPLYNYYALIKTFFLKVKAKLIDEPSEQQGTLSAQASHPHLPQVVTAALYVPPISISSNGRLGCVSPLTSIPTPCS
jgi:hypothetical protein